MAQEIEIKLKITEAKAFRLKLKHLGAELVGTGSGRVHEWNVLFDTPERALAKNGQLLRIRTETLQPKTKRRRTNSSRPGKPQRFLLTFKRPIAETSAPANPARQPNRHKVREELELEVTSAIDLARIFEGLGMKGWFRYEKYRTTFRLPASVRWAKGLLIELDETCIGTFVELEGPAEAIDRAAKKLGYSTRDYILQNYLSLYFEDCRQRGQKPGDMVFERTK
ncbi:MAG: class IV adenylate cyclase [Candidatus Acidiferrum sp.]|jgi:adenylate cyclase class 2